MRLRLNKIRFRWWLRLLARVSVAAIVVCAVLFAVLDQWLLPFPQEKLGRPSGTFVYSQDGVLLTGYTSPDKFWRLRTRLTDISPKLIQSVLTVEDKYFYYHPGVNPLSLAAAAVDNLRAGKIVRGGSTITMQIARMIEPKERTVGNKLLEIFRSAQLELRYTKDELLELYFNLVPYGGNIEGVGAAAWFYFGKQPNDLTWSEAAALTAIPASPERFRPDLYPQTLAARRARVLAGLCREGVITDSVRSRALAEELPGRRFKIPRTAPHFSDYVRTAYPDSSTLVSTLQLKTQSFCERLTADYRPRLAARDIHQVAIVVLDNRSAGIVAMVGSSDFDDSRHAGQVNGALSARSPGSALKPFVYALAFEKGLLSPKMKVADIPVTYGGYSPDNYDETYHGVISVRDALIHSYNVPVVNAAMEIGLTEVYSLLRRGGLTTIDRECDDYGLPLVLGAVEVRPLDVANLYSAIARGGSLRSIRNLRDQPEGIGTSLLPEAVCYLVTDILTDLTRPDLPQSWKATAEALPIAWKTGTSYGRRDAWAVGYTATYTVAVWAGNFSGAGSSDLVGAEIAAPIMFDIFNEITSADTEPPRRRPPDVSTRAVCAVSGQPPGRFCSHTETELFVPGLSPSQVCSVHRPVFIDRETGHRLTAQCTSQREYEQKVVEKWPPELSSWLVANGLAVPLLPMAEQCGTPVDRGAPVIVSPEDDAVYQLVADVDAAYQKIHFATSLQSGRGRVHWFLDDELFAVGDAAEKIFYSPAPGRHTLLCVDAEGRSDRIVFRVESL